jgi:pimeloyl-ACP methyl ester carboxylesterase
MTGDHVPTLDRDGVAIHYEVHRSGDGPPLLLTHGYSASAAMFAGNLAALGADRTVVTWDIRGHGDSDSPDDLACYSQDLALADMAAILDAVGAPRAVLGGHSLGGYLSLAFRLAHPERVAGLLLIDTGPGYKRDAGREAWNRMAEGFAVGFETRGLDALAKSPEAKLGRHDPRGLALAARGILKQHDFAVMASLADIDVPTLVLVGSEDEAFLAAAEIMAAKIPGAVSVTIEGAAHAPNLDRPAEFDAAVTGFLAAAGL